VKLIRFLIGNDNFYLLKRFRHKIFQRKVKLNPNFVYFLHIGKSGGTALGNKFQNEINPKSELKFVPFGHNVKLYHLDKKQKYIFSVRDPISRYHSGFYSRLRKGMPRIKKEHDFFEKISFFFYKDSNSLAEDLYSSNPMKVLLARFSMCSIIHLNEPISSWFSYEELQKHPPEFLFDQKNLDKDYKKFCQVFNLTYSKLGKGKVVSHKNDYTGKPELSKLAKQNLKRYFEKDILLYEKILKRNFLKKS